MCFADTRRALLTMVAYSLIGNTVLAVQPMVVGGLVDLLHFTQRQAGFIASAELAGFSAAGLAVLAVVHRVDRRLLALTGVLLLASADVVACFSHDFVPMLIVRCAAGIGSAVAYAILPVLAAASSRPERVFGIVNAASIAYAGAFVWIAPRLLVAWHLPGIFLTMALLALGVSGTIFWLPGEIRARGGQVAAARGTGSSGRPVRLQVAMLLLVTLCLYVGHGAIWAYQERIGVAAGLYPSEVGSLLGSSMLIWGVSGSLLATGLGMLIGRIWPQLLALMLSILAAALLVMGSGLGPYGVACAAIAFSWFYGLPYLSGWLAKLDSQGRANIACMLISTLGSALGPALAALVIGNARVYGSVGVLAGSCYVICFCLVAIAGWCFPTEESWPPSAAMAADAALLTTPRESGSYKAIRD